MKDLYVKLCIFAGLCCLSSIRTVASNDKYPFFPHSKIDEQRIRKMVDDINTANISWKAEYNAKASLKGVLMGWAVDPEEMLASLQLDGLDVFTSVGQQIVGDTQTHLTTLARGNITVPESFDAREKWSRCASINQIQNQGGCGSCWAAATVSVLSDRLCISSDAKEQEMISLQDLVSCCEYCGNCGGSWSTASGFLYWKEHGIVTGGSFGSSEGCRPYEVAATCGTPCPSFFMTLKYFQKCKKTCNKNHSNTYESDLKKGKSFYWLTINKSYREAGVAFAKVFSELDRVNSAFSLTSTDYIKRDIMINGPVSACTRVAEPFAHYRSGIFTSSFDSRGHENLSYGHCMRLIGWGTENGEEFWTVANSWGTEWGENGFGRISIGYYPEMLSVVGGLW